MLVLGSQGNLYWHEGNVKFKSIRLKQDHPHVLYLSFLNKKGIFYALLSCSTHVSESGLGNKFYLQRYMQRSPIL